MNWIKKWIDNQQSAYEEGLTMRIRDDFKVVEKGGQLFIAYDGIAIKTIDSKATAEDIVRMITEVRDTSQLFRNL